MVSTTNTSTPIARGLLERLRVARMRRQYLVARDLQGSLTRQFLMVLLIGGGLALCNAYILMEIHGSLSGMGTLGGFEIGLVMVYGLASVGVSFGLVILLCVFYSHRVAGPAVKLEAALERMAEGDLDVTVRLRATDELQSIATALNTTAKAWRESIQAIDYCILELKDVAEEDPRLVSTLRELDRVSRRFSTAKPTQLPRRTV